MNAPDRVERFIKLIRDIDPDYMAELFQNGGCFHLYLILREIWPEAEAWYSNDESHVYVRIDRRWYDIRGRRRKPQGDFEPLPVDEHRHASQWLPSRHACTLHEHHRPMRA